MVVEDGAYEVDEEGRQWPIEKRGGMNEDASAVHGIPRTPKHPPPKTQNHVPSDSEGRPP